MDQKIRFARSRDGTRIAYSESGAGTPLVKTGNWLSHLEFDWDSPVWRHWFRFFSSRGRFVRYDARGCGLSDWQVADLTLDAHVADLEAVVDSAGLERFALLGISQGGAVAIAYAARHPERVTKLILFGAFGLGWYRAGPRTAQQARAALALIEVGWGGDNPAFRQLFTKLFFPAATSEQERWFDELMRISSTPAIAARILQGFGDVDVREQLPGVTVPTLVAHTRLDACIPVKLGRELAIGIPGAQFLELDSANHVLLEHEPAWHRFCEAVDRFLDLPGASAARSLAVDDRRALESLTTRERQVLDAVARGDGNAEIAARLYISEKTVRNHLTNIFDKLGVDTRAKAIVLARDHGLPAP